MLNNDLAIEAIKGALDRERAAGNPSEIIGMSYQFAEAMIEMLKSDKRLIENQARLAFDLGEQLKEKKAEIRQLRLALDIAKGTCKGITAEGR